ncbi:MAG: hypothetical protein FJ368_07250 [Pelagibacterales bacterium]|nr:hypothetical protein [Pelagibacterales bacterium]
MDTTFNIFDLIFFGSVFLFSFIAFFRGLVKEIASFLIWVISAAATYFLSPLLTKFLLSYYQNETVLYFASRSLIFIAIFLTLSLSLSESIKNFKERVPTLFDKSFGALFGVIKAILIFAIFYSAVYNASVLVSIRQNFDVKEGVKVKMPSWIENAKCGNVLKISSSVVDPLVKKFVEAISEKVYNSNLVPEKSEKEINDSAINEEKNKNSDKNLDGNSSSENLKESGGYNKRDIEKMNRLIEIIE